jgi:hypothetical protein
LASFCSRVRSSATGIAFPTFQLSGSLKRNKDSDRDSPRPFSAATEADSRRRVAGISCVVGRFVDGLVDYSFVVTCYVASVMSPIISGELSSISAVWTGRLLIDIPTFRVPPG